MGLQTGLQIIGKAIDAARLATQSGVNVARAVATKAGDVVGIFCRKAKPVNPAELKVLRFAPETIVGDTVKFSTTPISKNIKTQGNTLVDDIVMYIEGYKQKGEHFIPTNLDTSSPTFKFIEYCKKCKIEPTVKDYEIFLFGSMKHNFNYSREEILKLCELRGKEIAEELKKIPGINPKIIENAPQIEQWSNIIRANSFQFKNNLFGISTADQLLQDDVLYKQAAKNFERLATEITGKKVLLIGSDDLDFLPSAVLSLGNPKVHQGAEYIILGHGTGSSLITDTLNPNTWRFEATGESVWKFIEKNVPKGKKCAVCVCEEGGLELAGKTLTEMIDKKGQVMYGIGNAIDAEGFPMHSPLKYCESGIRHITGHARGETIKRTFNAIIPECITRDWEIVNYAL